jgi:hypothetical protein
MYLGSPGVESGMRGQQVRHGGMSIGAEYVLPPNGEAQQYNVVHRKTVSVEVAYTLDKGHPGRRLNSLGVAGQAVS